MAETESIEEMLPRAVLPTAPVMVDIACQNDIKMSNIKWMSDDGMNDKSIIRWRITIDSI